MAYCMLGLFDLNIPLLYGEGAKAFIRLQEEIIRVSNDQTIFCWSWITPHVPKDWRSIMAPSPAVFEFSGEYSPYSWAGMSAYTITNAGLSIALPLAHTPGSMKLASLSVVHDTGSWDELSTVAVPLEYGDNRLLIRSPFPPGPIKLRSGMFSPKEAMMIDVRNLRNGYLPRRPDLSARWHGVFLAVSPSMRMVPRDLPMTVNGEWDYSTSTFWIRRVGRNDFGAGILSIMLHVATPSSGGRQQRRLTVLFAIQETAPGVIRTAVQQVWLNANPDMALSPQHLPERREEEELRNMVQNSVAMAEADSPGWETSLHSTGAAMMVDVSSGEDCFRASDTSLVSICQIRAEHDDRRQITRNGLHLSTTM
jgi:hypothetical protein